MLRLEVPRWFQPRAQDRTCHANPGWISPVSPGISEESTPLLLVLDAIDPDETAAIRLNLQRQHALRQRSLRGAIEH